MGQAWFEALRGRISGAWAVLTGRAYAGYSVPDPMDEVRLRIALLSIANNTCCDGCQEAAKVARTALEPQFTDPFQSQLS